MRTTEQSGYSRSKSEGANDALPPITLGFRPALIIAPSARTSTTLMAPLLILRPDACRRGSSIIIANKKRRYAECETAAMQPLESLASSTRNDKAFVALSRTCTRAWYHTRVCMTWACVCVFGQCGTSMVCHTVCHMVCHMVCMHVHVHGIRTVGAPFEDLGACGMKPMVHSCHGASMI
mmetsp:Transcript_21179/g.58947  ORF Transcript_21179/g.58947 Transcript_21179/m.58947 type:complete len:179 (-) Transcript_21179:2984-3520(-)